MMENQGLHMGDTFFAAASSGLLPATESVGRVLAVDHDAATRLHMSLALKSWDIKEVVLARDAAEALRLQNTGGPFDLVIADADLRGVSGSELVAKLRSEGLRAPVLVMSSQRTLETFANALRSGADDVLQKPVDLNELRHAMSALMARSAERERFYANKATPPLHGALVTIEQNGSDASMTLCAPTHSAQLESFQRVCERMAAPGLTQSERMHLHLALEEILQNAREWGNRFDVLKQIRFSFTPKLDRVQFCIEDEGSGFNPAAIPDPSVDPKAHIKSRIASGKRIGGWGLFIARKRMDEVSFNAKGNAVCVTKLFRIPPHLPSRS